MSWQNQSRAERGADHSLSVSAVAERLSDKSVPQQISHLHFLNDCLLHLLVIIAV
ncbi:hypothetical protein GALMADRAFT_242212, partial [Galerina marginata CBS 339.88]